MIIMKKYNHNIDKYQIYHLVLNKSIFILFIDFNQELPYLIKLYFV